MVGPNARERIFKPQYTLDKTKLTRSVSEAQPCPRLRFGLVSYFKITGEPSGVSRWVISRNPAAYAARLAHESYFVFFTSAAYTCDVPCMLERNTTQRPSGVMVTFGSVL